MLGGLLGLALLIIAGRLAQLQLVEWGRWREAAAAIQERTIELSPRRGSILDRDGALLAFDVKATAIAVDSYNMTKPEQLIAILSEELGMNREILEDRVYRPSYFTWIDRRVDVETGRRIEARANEERAHGLIFFDTWKRCYPQGRLASNVVGFVGLDGDGLEGIELEYDEVLRGEPAVLHVIQGADGRTYWTEVIDEGVPGIDIALTLDAELQFVCEEAIERGVERFRASAGMIVVLDPATGETLCMAQDKGFDLNESGRSSAEQRKNLAVSFLFEPGSIFKAFTGLAALDAGLVTVGESFDGNDGIVISGHTMHNSEFESYGPVTFAEIIEHSINTAMIRVAFRLGADVLHDAFVRLGFGEPTGIELPGEEAGILRPPDEWTPLDLAAASIGQSVAVTGIQLARGLAAIAADGRLPDISIVLDPRPECGPASPATVVAERAGETMRSLMQQVVESGTGTSAAIDGFTVAGKTGTAQKAVAGRGYVEGKYTSLFAGMVPADAPRWVIVVVLDEVKTTPVWGGVTAGSIFHEAATRLILAERIPSTTSDTFRAQGEGAISTTDAPPSSGQALFGRP